MKKVVFILGPTAVGKSEFAIAIAKKFNGEIISADSVQVYKKLNIGSAKIMDMKGVVHHGIDILEPNENFSVFDFVEYSKKKIDEISAKGKLPIVVGGTGLYIKALTEGYNLGGVSKNDALREKLEEDAKEFGLDFLYQKLQKINPQMAEKTDKNNKVRVIRALEIALSNGEKAKTETYSINPLLIALNRTREKLYEGINARVDVMFKSGLVQEVEGLVRSGITRECQSMRAIGYKEVLDYLDGKADLETTKNLIKQHTRNYAKRQLTFLRGMNCHMVDVENVNEAKKEIFECVERWL